MNSEMEDDPLMVQILPDHQTSPSPTYTLTKPKPTKSIFLVTLAAFVSVAMTLGLFFVFCSIPFSVLNWTCPFRYSVVIDAGSSGTRAHVFRYRTESGKPVYDFGPENYASLKLSPGLSSYADKPDGASVSVAKLVEFAKGRVPSGMLKKSDVRLMATAGMRLLDVSVQEKILQVTRGVLRSSGFNFRDEWASVISGSDEGVYAWVVANYARGSLGGDPLQTTGTVELGGASAQVTFVSSETLPPGFSRKITYGGVAYNLYTHSFLHYGQDEAEEDLLESLRKSGEGIVADPCTPKGYSYNFDKNSSRLSASVQAAGDFSKCRSLTTAMLQKGTESCAYNHCSIGSTFTPHLQGRFLATENFYYTAKLFKLEEKGWLSKLVSAGKSFCGEEWSKLKEKYPTTKEKYLHGYCFSSAYTISMLHDSLGFALDDERIEYADKAGEKGIPLNWALGAFILNTATATSDHIAKSRKMLV
ncbi:unnamed protein product [Thlaspi arvense]|uniref:apyrase n=1 Tax=Thlaspi arvense TaxID=13288 RepID=A0AAU9RF69_THLAR|nr:unnamed protein product [Thlaspi arvense]